MTKSFQSIPALLHDASLIRLDWEIIDDSPFNTGMLHFHDDVLSVVRRRSMDLPDRSRRQRDGIEPRKKFVNFGTSFRFDHRDDGVRRITGPGLISTSKCGPSPCGGASSCVHEHFATWQHRSPIDGDRGAWIRR